MLVKEEENEKGHYYNINGGTKIDLELLKIVDSSSPLATPCTGR